MSRTIILLLTCLSLSLTPSLTLANEVRPAETNLTIEEEALLVTVVMVGFVLTVTLTTGVGLTLYALSDEEE